MRVTMLTQWFDPEPNLKGLLFARELVARGHQVRVITGFPNYPGGNLYDGYRIKLFQRENIDGVAVLRVPLYPSHDVSRLSRVANYASFAISAATLGNILTEKSEVLYVYHPPATIGIPAIAMKLLRHMPYVLDIQDLWPDTLASTMMLNNHAVLHVIDKWCRLVYRGASRIAVNSPGFKRKLCEKGVPADKIEVIYNWCDEREIKPGPRNEELARKLGFAGRFNIVYAGNMGRAQALGSVIDAASQVQEQLPKVQFVLMGGGLEVEALKRKADVMRLSNVAFLAHRPMSEAAEILNLADALLVHLKDDPLFRITIPSKTQAYMAAGRPILMGVEGDAGVLVRKAGAGLVCRPNDPTSIALAVEKFTKMTEEQRETLGANGRRFYQQRLCFDEGVSRFESLLKQCTRKTRATGGS